MKKHEWSKVQIAKLKEMWEEEKTFHEISDELDMSLSQVWRKVKKLGLHKELVEAYRPTITRPKAVYTNIKSTYLEPERIG